MITLTSSTQSDQEIQEALKHFGNEVVTEDPEAKPAESAPSGESGSPATPESKTTPPATDAGKKPPEPQAAPPDKPGKQPNFKGKLERAEENLAHLREELEAERGDKSKLSQKIEELEAKIAELSGTKPAEEKKDEGPVKPTRPKRADYDFDEDKYEEALGEYEEKLAAYNEAVTDLKVKQALEADHKQREQEEQNRVQEQRRNEYNERLIKGIAEIPEYDATIEALGEAPVPMPPVMETYIAKSKNPALLIYTLAQDVLENEAKELERLSELDPIDMVAELRDLERRITQEHEANKKPAAKPVVAAAPPEEKKPEPPPAKPKPAVEVKPPIEPVGSRAASSNPQLGNATSLKEYILMRRQGVNR